MHPDTFSSFQAASERKRIVAAAQALLLGRSIKAVGLADIAIALRIPVAAIERQFPAGMPDLVQASLEAHIQDIHTRLLAQRQECSNAVEELLAMRRLLHQQTSDTSSLFMQELAASYPVLNQGLQQLRATFTFDYLVENLERGLIEGYYRSDVGVQEQANTYLQQADTVVQAARTSAELTEGLHTQLSEFLAGIVTPLGSYIVRRLQETPPYY